MDHKFARASRGPRSDSLRNRERLISAAREVFGEGGASLEAVARRAGVGIGTLYRHFPTRDALFQAVYAPITWPRATRWSCWRSSCR